MNLKNEKRKKESKMIITFATQKGGVGKTTLAIAFANYMSLIENKEVKVFDFDYQKSFFAKWEEDNEIGLPQLYEVEVVDEENPQNQIGYEKMMEMKSSDKIFLFDLAGTLDQRYIDLLILSDFIVIPFEYSDVSTKSTLVFINILGLIESFAKRIFIRSKYDKGYFYKNQAGMDQEIQKYGKLLNAPVYKRNDLQNINTRKLLYNQKYAVAETFNELIQYINEVNQTEI